ncbi:hypothetical protein CTM97_20690 [Photobacterium phosphoreum]|uniref:SMODS-associated and fused to various effectors domain-containing protein n=1 Tax=Photobacterium phosphoreum TaxID=659 RepID=A0A2T3JEY2_PHOPO|nr:hypothetical protein [Photobacterium phosphoreum]PSU21416.1 hypothetical protein CTM96_17970 [Photobacterium phosphoreum]PSU37291.1 hypothetical protein CTM97_20690 [Photobacterium phosphoreum]PSU47446.1 hypothetical protein C9J18_18940 [Photobacterium phosphoreum]
MIFDKVAYTDNFDLAIYGLGYESRSTSAYKNFGTKAKKNIILGYESNKNAIKYNENKNYFSETGSEIYEFDCETIILTIKKIVSELINKVSEPRIFLDITVMSRHRLAGIIFNLLSDLPEKSIITICYNSSYYVAPPEDIQPVKELGPIISELSGDLGNLSMPTSVVFGLGYEKNKALGVYNYYDADYSYAFIPKNIHSEFEDMVIKNNEPLLNNISEKNIFTYDVTNPYTTYIDLKSLILSLTEVSRIILVPLGPKIISAISVIIGKELYPKLPVWRVSSLHTETPMEKVSNKEILFSITI